MNSKDGRSRALLCAILFLAVLGKGPPVLSRPAEDPSAYKGWTVSSLEVRGAGELGSELQKGLALARGSGLFGKGRPVFYPETLGEDLRRARLFLARRGYPRAEITPFFDAEPRKKRVGVVLDVKPGAPVRVAHRSLQGLPSDLGPELSKGLPLREGGIFTDDALEAARRTLESELRERGHARARVETSVERAGSAEVSVTIAAEPGPVYRIRGVGVKGTSDDLVPLARKTAGVERGDLYSPSLLSRARDNLRLLDLFRRIRLEVAEAGVDSLDLQIDLAERKPRTVEIGAGYWTDDQLKARTRWEHRNLFGSGRGGMVSGSASRFLQEGSVSLWWPAMIGSRTRGVLRTGVERQREDSYVLVDAEVELAARYRHSLAATVRAGVAVSHVDVDVRTEDPGAFVQAGGLLTIFSLRWSRDTSDDRLSPTSGTVTRVSSELSPPGSLSRAHYVSLETSATAYLPVAAGVVGALRLAGGVADPIGESVDLLPNKRFYAGGATSMRGFKRRKLGPLDSQGAPLGGEAKAEASGEIRFPLVWLFRGALFVDAGQVWRRKEQVRARDVELAAGPGLMILTPVGPVRGDLGFRLTDRQTGEPDVVFHLSIGHPF